MSLSLGPFTLGAILGRGGMGEVWSGTHRSGAAVAVKVITREKARSERFMAAFRREVRTTAGLQHQHTCGVYDYGAVDEQAQRDSGGRLVAGSPWLAMERAEGSLEPLCGRCDWPALQRILLELLDGLAHAHARGVIHRDIKPANVLLFSGVSKLADFGIAQAEASQPLAEGGSSVGTPSFMPPEQLSGRWRDFGPPTDLFALGATAWMLACGRLPHRRDRLIMLQQGRPAERVPFLPARPMPRELAPWLTRMLDPDPRRRYPSAAAAARALLQLDHEDMTGAATAWEDDAPPDAEGTLLWAFDGGDSLAPEATATLDFEPFAAPPALDAPAAPQSAVPQPEAPPPLPPGWRRERPPASLRLQGVGLGLYGLRAVPVVGRERERDALWGALAAVCEGRGARGILLEGAAGVGKSRLARWLGQRALECGAASALTATYSQHPSAADGLVAALERHLRLQGLSRPEVAARLRALLDIEADETLGELTELIRPLGKGEPSQGVPAAQLNTLEQRRAALLRALRLLCAQRPLVLWLDDVQWSRGALPAVQALLTEEPHTDVLVLMTARTEARAEGSSQDRQLTALAASPSVSVLPVAALTEGVRAALVEELLGLSGALAEQVAARTGGNPLFAIQLVGDWVERGILVEAEGGFALAPGATAEIPDAIHDLWTDRLTQALIGQPADALRALELAALLGAEVDGDEWAGACEAAGLSPPLEALDALKQRGLALHRDGGWAFAHGMLAESIERVAAERGRLNDHKRAVGATLLKRGEAALERGANPTAEAVLSRAEHLLRAGEHQRLWVRASLPLARARMRLSLNEQAARGLSDALTAARERGYRKEEGVLLIHIGAMHSSLSRLKEARAIFLQALPIVREVGDRQGEANIQVNLSTILSQQGQLEEGLEHLEAALVIHREIGNRAFEAITLCNLGVTYMRQGRADEAFTSFTKSLAIHRERGDRQEEGRLLNGLAILHKQRGRYEEALAHLEAALVIQREVGNRLLEAMVLNNLGNIYQSLGRLAESLAHQHEALAINRAIGRSTGEALALGSIGEVLLARGDLDGARDALTQAADLCAELGNTIDEGSFRGSLGQALGRAGEHRKARAAMAAAEALLRPAGAQLDLGLLLCQRAEVERLAGARDGARSALLEAEGIATALDEGPDTELRGRIAGERAALSSP